jgi:hypothetical protein
MNSEDLRDWLKTKLIDKKHHKCADTLCDQQLAGKGFKEVTKDDLTKDYKLPIGAAQEILAVRNDVLRGQYIIYLPAFLGLVWICLLLFPFRHRVLCALCLFAARALVVSALPCLLMCSVPYCFSVAHGDCRCCHKPLGLVSHILCASVDLLTGSGPASGDTENKGQGMLHWMPFGDSSVCFAVMCGTLL